MKYDLKDLKERYLRHGLVIDDATKIITNYQKNIDEWDLTNIKDTLENDFNNYKIINSNKLDYNYTKWNDIAKELENKNIKIKFDYNNNNIIINNRKIKVENDRKYVHKTLKTKVKAFDGLKGLIGCIIESNNDGFMSCVTSNMLEKYI